MGGAGAAFLILCAAECPAAERANRARRRDDDAAGESLRSKGATIAQRRERRRQRNFKYSRLRLLASNGGVNTMLASRKRSPSRYPLRVTSDLPA